jgi:hypothetical protein
MYTIHAYIKVNNGTTDTGVVNPDPVGSASLCRIRIGIQGIWIRIPDPDLSPFQPKGKKNYNFFQKLSIYCPQY